MEARHGCESGARMPKLTRIYTRTGDDGTTGLVGGQRVKKNALRIEAYGTIDELSSVIGLARAALTEVLRTRPVQDVQRAHLRARALDDERVKVARARLFGSWEMNWMAYNYAQDVTLPGSSGPPVRFLMYPQAETAEGRLDSLDHLGVHFGPRFRVQHKYPSANFQHGPAPVGARREPRSIRRAHLDWKGCD